MTHKKTSFVRYFIVQYQKLAEFKILLKNTYPFLFLTTVRIRKYEKRKYENVKKGQDKTISSFKFHTICTKLTCADII